MRWISFFYILLSGISYAQEDPTITCLKNFVGDQRFSPIENKLSLADARDTTFEMLANQALPSKKEQEAIAAWVTARKECVKEGDAFHRQNYPLQIVTIVTEGENNIGAIAADLYNRKLTYGNFNKRRQGIADDVMNKVAAVAQQMKTQQELQQKTEQQAKKQDDQRAQDAALAAQQRDMAEQRAVNERTYRAQQAQKQQDDLQRRQASDTLLNNILLNNMRPQPYQAIQPFPMPAPSTNTNCYQTGNQLNCTTR